MAGYNHYSWCSCGWCVNKNRGYVKDRVYKYEDKGNSSDFSKVETYESFTIPNVRCKCCGKEIYFYQSPYGGKVFFNELGHPWEKHCCEKKCCAKEKETIPYDELEIRTITKNKPSWEKDGWFPAIFMKAEKFNSSLIKIILKSMVDYKEYTFFIKIQKNILLKKQEMLLMNFKKIDESLYKISFFINKKYILIANLKPKIHDLKEYIDIQNSLILINRKDIFNIELVEIFFKILNISDKYKLEKEQLYNFIINNENSIKSGMSDIYKYIRQNGLKEFEKNLFNKFKFYDERVINILFFTSSPSTYNIKKIISKKRKEYEKNKLSFKENKEEIIFNKKNKTNLNRNKKQWKGISIYKPKKKKLTIIQKDEQ